MVAWVPTQSSCRVGPTRHHRLISPLRSGAFPYTTDITFMLHYLLFGFTQLSRTSGTWIRSGEPTMLTIILIVLVILLLFGGGGFYARGRR